MRADDLSLLGRTTAVGEVHSLRWSNSVLCGSVGVCCGKPIVVWSMVAHISLSSVIAVETSLVKSIFRAVCRNSL